MGLDLDQYRRAHNLSYEKLGQQLGLSSRRRAMAWATGETWPDADRLQRIFDITEGEVTLNAMYRRRLKFLSALPKDAAMVPATLNMPPAESRE